MIEYVPFRKEHAMMLDTLERGTAPKDIVRLGTGANNNLDSYLMGPAQTAWEAEPILCAGIIPVWDGLWDAWCMMNGKAKNRARLHKYVRRTMQNWEIVHRVRRLQAYVRAANLAARDYVAFLGFAPEAHLRSFGPKGEDVILYVRIHDD